MFNIEYHETIKRICLDKCGVSNQYVICYNAPIELAMNWDRQLGIDHISRQAVELSIDVNDDVNYVESLHSQNKKKYLYDGNIL